MPQNDPFGYDFPLAAFRQDAEARRRIETERALMPTQAPRLAGPSGAGGMLRGVDLAALGQQQGARQAHPAIVGMLSRLQAYRGEQQDIADENLRRDRLRAMLEQESAQALNQGMKFGGAIASKYLAPATDRWLSGLGPVDRPKGGA